VTTPSLKRNEAAYDDGRLDNVQFKSIFTASWEQPPGYYTSLGAFLRRCFLSLKTHSHGARLRPSTSVDDRLRASTDVHGRRRARCEWGLILKVVIYAVSVQTEISVIIVYVVNCSFESLSVDNCGRQL